MITRIEATRYRCLERLDAELGEFCVLVGANGAGKSTFLDIPCLMSDLLHQRDIGAAFTTRLRDRPPRASTLQELVFANAGDQFSLAVEIELPKSVISSLLVSQSGPVKHNEDLWLRFARYEIKFTIFNKRQLIVSNEYLFLFSRDSVPARGEARIYGEAAHKKDWRFVIQREPNGEASIRSETKKSAKAKPTHVDGTMLALPRVSFETADDFPAAIWLHELLTTRSVFYQPDLNALQEASPPGIHETLSASASNLPWLVLKLQMDETRFNRWVQHVRTALPQVNKIAAREREEDHHAYLVVTYTGGYEVTSSGLSEGTLRILALTVLPYLQKRPALIVTEQPEDDIHPRAIEAVLQSISSVYDSQVLVSSHSPVVLAHTKLDQILCARLEPNGAATVVPGTEHPRLKEWRGQIDLGALFAAGVLG